MLATDGIWRGAEYSRDAWRGALAPALVSSIALLLSIGVFLCIRRLSGALEVALAPVPLVVTAIGLLAWTLAVRLRLRDRRVAWLLVLVLALFAVACSYPGTRLIDWLVWLGALAALALVPARRSSPAIGSDQGAGQVLQQLSRSRGADGSEIVHGTLLAEFAPAERIAVLHVAFCPPFERLPSVEAEVADGPACDVKIVQVLHQGARLEARLAHASTVAEQVRVEFAATGCTA